MNYDNFKDNLQSYLETIDLDDHNQAASSILNKCVSMDDGNDYMAIVYDAITGWSKHGVSAGDQFNFFRQKGSSGEANVVVLYGPKGTPVNDQDAIKNYLDTCANIKMDKSGWEEFLEAARAVSKVVKLPYSLLVESIETIITGHDYTGFSEFAQWLVKQSTKAYDSNEEFITDWSDNKASNMALWDCRRYNGVWGAWNNSQRAIWEVGTEYTMATLKPVT